MNENEQPTPPAPDAPQVPAEPVVEPPAVAVDDQADDEARLAAEALRDEVAAAYGVSGKFQTTDNTPAAGE